ncbi:hypothetical protein [Streptomyces sp. NPDC050264]|uniref:hypothetical protein n=1 Tax=Streptomyces sp. NPDC050264 TaxID=3155038 RepID=UPI00343D654A
MVPGARTIRVSQREPGQTWPSPYARAYDRCGQLITISRAQGRTAARWIIRTHPEADWSRAHDLDLTTGSLHVARAAAFTVAEGGL